MKYMLLVLALVPVVAFAQQGTPPANPPKPTGKLTYAITSNNDKTFGYDIFNDGKLLVRQPTIPGRPGLAGFKTRTDAEKVAKLVIGKIKQGQMPPTVEEKELKKLNI